MKKHELKKKYRNMRSRKKKQNKEPGNKWNNTKHKKKKNKLLNSRWAKNAKKKVNEKRNNFFPQLPTNKPLYMTIIDFFSYIFFIYVSVYNEDGSGVWETTKHGTNSNSTENREDGTYFA